MWPHSSPNASVRIFSGVGSRLLRDLPSLLVSWTGKQMGTIASRASGPRVPETPAAASAPYWSARARGDDRRCSPGQRHTLDVSTLVGSETLETASQAGSVEDPGNPEFVFSCA